MDYVLTIIFSGILYKWLLGYYVGVPSFDRVMDLASETVTILLTLSGFILTFLTVLISLRIDAGDKTKKPENELSIIEKFCHSGLYFDTTSIFKNSIKSTVTAAILIYIIRMFAGQVNPGFIFVVTIGGIIIMIMTIMRSLWILGKILDMQNNHSDLE